MFRRPYEEALTAPGSLGERCLALVIGNVFGRLCAAGNRYREGSPIGRILPSELQEYDM